jgi:hypothetical protein
MVTVGCDSVGSDLQMTLYLMLFLLPPLPLAYLYSKHNFSSHTGLGIKAGYP